MDNITSRKLYKEILFKRLHHKFTSCENNLINMIKNGTTLRNIDNISRTKSYIDYYHHHQEIKWSFLASMVSRNAGWSMTDLEGKWFPKILSKKQRQILFLTYEKANWLIFHDVYPQLLLYQASCDTGKPLFHLLQSFHVSIFMEIEWMRFWYNRDSNRLTNSLIINEQHVIQKPVIEHPFYKKNVFQSMTFQFQDWFHFSQVLFPTVDGELYGFSTKNFKNVYARISLGKRLAWLLFHEKYYPSFYQFSVNTTHTGSRHDYEKYFRYKKEKETPFLRVVYPVIEHSEEFVQKEWYNGKSSIEKLQREPKISSNIYLTDWYKKKQIQLQIGILLHSLMD